MRVGFGQAQFNAAGSVVPTVSWNAGLASDPNCVALWRFEAGALTVDGKGGNTLSPYNSPSADAADYREGAASLVLVAANSEGLYIPDASLDAGFPWKSGGSATGSVCFWFKTDVAGAQQALFSKWAGVRTLGVWYNNSNQLLFLQGYNAGADYDTVLHASGLTAGRWYHVGITYDGATDTVTVRIWDATAGAIVGSDVNHNFGNAMSLTTTEIEIGTRNGGTSTFLDGHMDEVVVFSDLLSAAEIDQIRQGVY
jgi:hypothetical protein